MTRSYSELRRLSTFADRYRYLSIGGRVGETTFGSERYVNQRFYRSREWRLIREDVILRDNGCDLGIIGYEIVDRPHIHHMNPMSVEDIEEGNADILHPDYLITVTQITHNAIHFGDERQLPRQFAAREPGDTLSWSRR